jgi:hypothetical protein
MALYRYKKIIDQYTTYTVQPPLDEGSPVEGFFEHGEIDGWTYFAMPDAIALSEQNPIIECEQVTPPQQYMQQLKEISPHYKLMSERANRGQYMREDKHIVQGTPTQVADWVAQTKLMLGIG